MTRDVGDGMNEIKLSAREVVEFIYSGGDLTNEFSQNAELIDGTKAHQYLQNKYKEEDRKEVYVKKELELEEFKIIVSGRMDGLLIEDGKSIIEEIKSTKTDLNYIEIDSRPQHLMQAKLYAYMYLEEMGKRSIYVRLTYINTLSYETKSFNKRFTKKELDLFFMETIQEYISWYKKRVEHDLARQTSISGLSFPFGTYREGQRELMGATYKTILNQDILFAIAPTGIGKTMATLFSSLKALKKHEEKLFYLTAKDVGKTVALNAMELLMNQGLKAKTIEITSKEKTCFMETVECNPDYCPYAKGFFNRLNEATEDIFTNEEIFSRSVIENYAEKHTICPFEYSLYLSYFADVILCDYNYAFDPRTHLRRYFDESTYQPILLVDEAHNLIQRSREMYSASIEYSKIKLLKTLLRGLKPSATSELKILQAMLEVLNEKVEKVSFAYTELVSNELIGAIKKILLKLDAIINDNKDTPKRKEIVDIYFMFYAFIRIHEYYNESFVFTIQKDKDEVIYSIRCLDASEYLLKTMKEKTIGTILFSATLFPLEYYQKLLTKDEGKYIHLLSPFPQDHLNLIVMDDTSTRYQDRNSSVVKLVEVIHTMVSAKKGNYIVFFPSFEYLNLVHQAFMDSHHDYDVLTQKRTMNSYEREETLNAFKNNNDKSQVAFFVMGGLFSEGIDYVGEMLSGVLIVGVALPMVSDYNNLLKSYFDERFNNGFEYAYTYPGLNKIIQAVGRVIRTEQDRGIAILFDDRFTHRRYRSLYPNEWNHLKVINDLDELEEDLTSFWNTNNGVKQ